MMLFMSDERMELLKGDCGTGWLRNGEVEEALKRRGNIVHRLSLRVSTLSNALRDDVA